MKFWYKIIESLCTQKFGIKPKHRNGKRRHHTSPPICIVSKIFNILTITDFPDKLGRSHWFSVLDRASGFHQIEMSPCSVDKTVWTVDNYKFLHKPFGFENAPSNFQNAQNKICMVHMVGIIFSTTPQEHIENL